MAARNKPGVYLTGATGYLGSLAAVGLLRAGVDRLILPVRGRHDAKTVHKRLLEAVDPNEQSAALSWLDRITVIPEPAAAEIVPLARRLRTWGIAEIAHCAGCVDYFDVAKLHAGNIVLTEQIVQLGQELGAGKLAFLSTAFSCGYAAKLVAETLHGDPEEDPTEYTRSKRHAERIIARSGLPWLIIRPCALLGDSRVGRYLGNNFGIYQFWSAAERLLSNQYQEVMHALAPPAPLQFLHQDAFTAGFIWAWEHLPADSVFHLVSRQATLPTMRDLWMLWVEACHRPREVYFYERLEDVRLDRLNRRQQIWLEFTAVNHDIAVRPWRFETTQLERLRALGMPFVDATIETLGVCQAHFLQNSPRLQGFMKKFAAQRQVKPNYFFGPPPARAKAAPIIV